MFSIDVKAHPTTASAASTTVTVVVDSATPPPTEQHKMLQEELSMNHHYNQVYFCSNNALPHPPTAAAITTYNGSQIWHGGNSRATGTPAGNPEAMTNPTGFCSTCRLSTCMGDCMFPIANVNRSAYEPSPHVSPSAPLLLKPQSPIQRRVPFMRWYANPQFAIAGGVIEIALLIYVLSSFRLIEGDFFRFGPPLQLFKFNLTSTFEFYIILLIFFLHQLVYTWLNEVVAPWILNEIQNPQCKYIRFSKPKTLLLVNLYYVYFTLNSFLVVNISLAQVSFLIIVLAADLIAVSMINSHYLWDKKADAARSLPTMDEESAWENSSSDDVQVNERSYYSNSS